MHELTFKSSVVVLADVPHPESCHDEGSEAENSDAPPVPVQEQQPPAPVPPVPVQNLPSLLRNQGMPSEEDADTKTPCSASSLSKEWKEHRRKVLQMYGAAEADQWLASEHSTRTSSLEASAVSSVTSSVARENSRLTVDEPSVEDTELQRTIRRYKAEAAIAAEEARRERIEARDRELASRREAIEEERMSVCRRQTEQSEKRRRQEEAVRLNSFLKLHGFTHVNEKLRSLTLYKYQYPLHVAVTSCNVDIVKLLLREEADTKCKNSSGLTPWMLALKCNKKGSHLEVLELLTE